MDKTNPDSAEARALQALDSALGKVLTPPALPDGFRQQLMAAMLQDAAADLAARQATLEAEHARLLAGLKADHVRLRRDTLAIVVGSAFAAGAASMLLAPWLVEAWTLDTAWVGPVLASVLGLGLAGWAGLRRFGVRIGS